MGLQALQAAATVSGSKPTQFRNRTDINAGRLSDVTCPLAAILELLNFKQQWLKTAVCIFLTYNPCVSTLRINKEYFSVVFDFTDSVFFFKDYFLGHF